MDQKAWEILLPYLPWPTVALVVALVAIGLFRKQIGEFLSRLTEFWWMKATPPTSQPPPKEISKELPSEPPKRATDSNQLNISPLQAPLFAEIEKKLKELGFMPEMERKYLIHTVVEAQFIMHHMRAARFVFGSQLGLLTQANGVGGPVPIVQAKEMYNQASRQFGNIYRGFSFDNWIGFLINNNFVVVQNDKVIATDLGRDFMNYLVNNHDTGNRIG
jgi:hypothetical protein